MIYVFYIICVVVFIISPSADVFGVSEHNLLGSFSYQFLHGNWLHLIINLLSLHLIYKPFRILYGNRFNYDNDLVLFTIIYLASVTSALFFPLPVPTVGASGMVFFILGAILALRPTKQQFINYIWVFLGIIVSAILGHSNTILHVVSLILGLLFIIARITYDNCRTKNNRRVQTN